MCHLQELYAKYEAKGLVILGFDASDDKKIALEMMHENGVTFPNIIDSSDAAIRVCFQQYQGAYGSSVPMNYIIDREGRSSMPGTAAAENTRRPSSRCKSWGANWRGYPRGDEGQGDQEAIAGPNSPARRRSPDLAAARPLSRSGSGWRAQRPRRPCGGPVRGAACPARNQRARPGFPPRVQPPPRVQTPHQAPQPKKEPKAKGERFRGKGNRCGARGN